jgi:hypothetical protein
VDPKRKTLAYKPMLESNFHDNTDVIPGLAQGARPGAPPRASS